MKKKIIVLTVSFLALFAIQTQAQIGFAVAKKNGSAVEWRMAWGKGSSWDCKMVARRYLENKGYKKVLTQEGGECCGHNTSSGYYVVVSSRYKDSSGSYITSYGLGASSQSSSDAKQKAIKNMSIHNWDWKKRYNVSIERRGTY